MSNVIPFLRTNLFFLGYYVGTVFLCSIFILIFPFLSQNMRHFSSTSWCKFILAWLRFSCGVRYRVTGLENITGQSIVVVANHQSEWETIFLYSFVSPISPILKKELLNIPFYGWALRLTKPIAIDRSNPRKAGRAVLTQGVERLHQGNTVILFPEGTRSEEGKIEKFSRGGAKLAIAAGVPVVPIAHDAGKCWPSKKFLKRPGTINVVIGKPIPSDGRDARELTVELESLIRNEFQAM